MEAKHAWLAGQSTASPPGHAASRRVDDNNMLRLHSCEVDVFEIRERSSTTHVLPRRNGM